MSGSVLPILRVANKLPTHRAMTAELMPSWTLDKVRIMKDGMRYYSVRPQNVKIRALDYNLAIITFIIEIEP